MSNSYYEKVDGETKKIVVPFIIPSTWEWVRLCSLGQIIGGGTPSTDIKEYWENGTISWITPADMGENKTKYITSTQRKISELGLSQSSATLMPPNSIVMSSRAPIGYLGISKISLCTNQGCKSIVPYCSELVEYLYYAIMMAIPDIKDRASGTTFKEISGKGFGQTIIPLPPLLEQKRIVDLLIKTEKQFAIVQSNYSDMIKQVEVLKYRILDSFFGENSRYKSYYTYNEEKLANIASLITKGSTPTTYGFEYLSEGINFIKVENVKDYCVQHETIKQFISEKAHEFQKRSQLEKNDLLISIAGTLGRICLIRDEDLPANTNQAFAIVRGYAQTLLPDYLKWFITWYVDSKSQQLGHGGGMNNLTLGEIKDLSIKYPVSKDEQQRIIDKVNACLEIVSAIQGV